MTQIDYSTWITKQDAAQAIGVHTKQIERLGQEGKLQVRKWKRPTGGTPIVVCHPKDVERLARERNPENGAFLVPALKEPADNGAQAVAVRPSVEQFLDALAAAVKTRETMSETSEIRLPLWLTLQQAVDYSGLPKATLVHMIATGELKARDVGAGRRGGRWRICKAVLEELR